MGAYYLRSYPPQPAAQEEEQERPGLFDPARYAHADQTTISRAAYRRMNDVLTQRIAAGRTLSHSDRLRASLEVDGDVQEDEDDPQTQAHHIVETSNAVGQAILRQHGVASDAATSGVLLPTEQPEYGPDLTLHLGRHTTAYRDCVNAALRAAEAGAVPEERDQAVAERLQEIRRVLLTKVVPLNSKADPDYDDRTGGAETIHQIFTDSGLFR